MRTEHKIYLGLAILSVAMLAGSFMRTSEPANMHYLPWHVEHPTPDVLRIFGLTLGQSNTNQAEQIFKENAKPSLFKSTTGQLTLEMFFEQVSLAGLRAKVVITLSAPDVQLQEIYERGLRISSTGSGKKIILTPEDIEKARMFPIESVTYMPSGYIESAVFEKRFGQPVQRIKEKKTGVVHWLYPQIGLDIALDDQSKPVLQYISPKHFKKLINPLVEQGEALN